MTLTPVEVRHLELRRGLLGYRRSQVKRTIEEIADSFEAVWRERSELGERVHELETEVSRHVELETLLRSTLVSAERAAQEMKEQARREAEVIVAEAGAQGRQLLRDSIAEKEQLLAETRRIRTILRAALEVLSEGDEHDEEADAEYDQEADAESGRAGAQVAEHPATRPDADRLAG